MGYVRYINSSHCFLLRKRNSAHWSMSEVSDSAGTWGLSPLTWPTYLLTIPNGQVFDFERAIDNGE